MFGIVEHNFARNIKSIVRRVSSIADTVYTGGMDDPRNVIDKFKHVPESDIVRELDAADHGLIIALENTERDINMGTIVRSANAFGVRRVIVIGRRQWNKRGAMATDKYLHVEYLSATEEFVERMREEGRSIVAIDNVPGSVKLAQTELPRDAVLVFGQEGPGISKELIEAADVIVAIEQFGSTRSINVGAAATVAMYAWLQRHVLQK
jgi:tRNA G18 (ribose-2'-O)-methylase SpoU